MVLSVVKVELAGADVDRLPSFTGHALHFRQNNLIWSPLGSLPLAAAFVVAVAVNRPPSCTGTPPGLPDSAPCRASWSASAAATAAAVRSASAAVRRRLVAAFFAADFDMPPPSLLECRPVT